MLTLVVGEHLAITRGKSGRASISSSESLSNCPAVMTIAAALSAEIAPMFDGKIPTCRAIALAVLG